MLAVAVAAGLVIALVLALVAASTPRHAAAKPASAASGSESAVLVDAQPAPGPLVNLGGVDVHLDNSNLDVNVTGPGGPHIDPNIATSVEPGGLLDGIVGSVVKGVNHGSGQLGVKTPNVSNIIAWDLLLGLDGRWTATLHNYEGKI